MTVSYELLKRLDHKAEVLAQYKPAAIREWVVVLTENGKTRELVMPMAPDLRTLARIAPNAVLTEVHMRSKKSQPAGGNPFFAQN
ncbi:hypothetical protein HJ526_06325 [Donghicola sp. C2-DW-16]|uniref:Uncharacterized protein n=1 Tax=Donghicola mangrovi TaxID=2729614 RepID=A0ABX2PC24_9RHOB|nr:hypothetical protein [Donghicola mangrovi]NVO27024.1 hypothetical protein [Donghicola mangrovi]